MYNGNYVIHIQDEGKFSRI